MITVTRRGTVTSKDYVCQLNRARGDWGDCHRSDVSSLREYIRTPERVQRDRHLVNLIKNHWGEGKVIDLYGTRYHPLIWVPLRTAVSRVRHGRDATRKIQGSFGRDPT